MMSRTEGQNWRTERCELCDVGFGDRRKLLEHYETKKHKQNKNKNILSDLVGIPEDGYVVYCIKITPVSQEKEYYYVGRTSDFHTRMRSHKQVGQPKKRFPDESKTETVEQYYEFVEFVDVEVCNSKDHAIIRERERAFELAQEKETVDVLGAQ
jgi:predicted GIY-YIG superfamily endonuclease